MLRAAAGQKGTINSHAEGIEATYSWKHWFTAGTKGVAHEDTEARCDRLMGTTEGRVIEMTFPSVTLLPGDSSILTDDFI